METKSTIDTLSTKNGRHRPTIRIIAALVTGLLAFGIFGAVVASPSGAQDALPADVCGAFKTWNDGGATPESIDIVLLPLDKAELPNSIRTLVDNLGKRTYQGAAQDQAIKSLKNFLSTGCQGGSTTTVADQSTTPTPGATPANGTPAATPNATPAATTGAATPAPTPATALPNTGATSDTMALLGGFVLFSGLAIAAFTRQRN